MVYTLSKEETYQMIVILKSVISSYSPLNNFLIDFNIEDSKEVPEKTITSLKYKKLFPPSFALVSAYEILSQPDRFCTVLIRNDENVFESNFFIKDKRIVEYNYDDEGTNYIHESISELEFVSNVVETLIYKNLSNTDTNQSKLKYVFTYSEYVVIVAMLYLEKDKDLLEIIGDIDKEGITKEDIVKYIRNENQFKSLWLLIGLNFIELDDFLNDIENQVYKIIDLFVDRGYIKKDSSQKYLSTTKKIYPLFEYISSYKKSVLTLSVEQYPDKNISIGYESGISILFSDKNIFELKFEDSRLNFYQLFSKKQVENLLKEQILSIPVSIKEEFENLKKDSIKSSTTKATIKRCSVCNAKLLPDAKFCTQCGAPVLDEVEVEQETTKCPICGAKLLPGAKFCTQCGAKL